MKKRLISLLLTVVMLLSLVVVPANAALVSGTGTLTITPNVTLVKGSTSAPAEVIYTIKVTPPTEGPVGEFHFNLKAPDGMTLADAEGEQGKEGYWVNPTLSYHKTYNKEGIFETFEYTPASKYFQASGTSASRNMTTEAEIMTIKATIAAGKVGDFTLTAEKVGINKDGTDSYSVDIKTTPVTVVSALTGELPVTIAKPVKGDTPKTTITGTNYTGSITWAPAIAAGGTFAANTEYTAKVELTANTGYQFASDVNPTVTDATISDKSVSPDGSKLEFKATFPETDSFPAASVTAAPTAKSGLKYDGTEQGLLGFVGNATGGAMQYSLDNSSWSDAIPTGKNAGDYTVYYKVVGDSTHSDSAVDSVIATIGQKDISGVTIGTIASQPYTGGAITPNPEVTDSTTLLEKDKDYTVSGTDNTYVGTNTAKLTITGKGNYTGTKDANFTITAVNQNPTFTTPQDLATGGAMLDLRTLVHGAKGDAMTFTIASGTAANLSGHTLTSTGITGAVTIKVSITAKDVNGDGTNEYNAFSKDDAITVNVVDKTPASLTVTQADTTYGTALADPVYNKDNMIDSTLKVTYVGRGSTSYAENTTKPTDAGTYTVKVTYETASQILSGSDDFEILAKSISGMTVTLDKTSLEYNGSAQTVNVTGVTGLSSSDYTLTSGNSGTDVGSYTVTVTGQGNYEGTATATWKITQATLTVTPAAGQSKKFKEADPAALTYTYSGNVSGETPAFNGKLDREAGENAGMYAIKLGDLALKGNGTFKASNYELKLSSTTVNFKITQAAAPPLTDIKLNQRYTVTTEQSKAIDTTGMPDDAGTLTYVKGTDSTTGSVVIDSWAVDATTGKVTYKLSGGKANDTVTLPVIIRSTNYADATVNVKITLVRGSSGGGSSAAVAPDMPLLRYGSRGEAVKILQEKLNAKGYSSGNVDGIFGTKTRAAVISFQKATGLGVDGIVGKLTWAKLYDAAPVSVVAPAMTAQPMLRSGSRGDAVRKLQELLNARGHNCGAVDGIFGVKTRAAVIAFQKANGLSADGIVGPLTWGKLI